MTAAQKERSTVFISYSHRDKRWLERLRTHLAPLERDRQLETWDDTQIPHGSDWRSEIRKALSIAKVAVLLISPDFLASEFIATEELPQLLESAARNGTLILPVILRSSLFAKTNLGQFQAVNDPAKPLATLSRANQDAILVKLAETILESVSSSGRLSELSADKRGKESHDQRLQYSSTNSRLRRPILLTPIVILVGALIASLWFLVHKPARLSIVQGPETTGSQDANGTPTLPLQTQMDRAKSEGTAKKIPIPGKPQRRVFSVDEYVERADRLLGAKDYKGATSICDQGLTAYPGNEKLDAEKRRIEIMKEHLK